MAINARCAKIICDGFKEIFNVYNPDMLDTKDDSGYECIGILVDKINSTQFKKLKNLTNEVPNSITIEALEGRLHIIFF